MRKKGLIFVLAAAMVFALSVPAMALDLNLNFDFNVGGTEFFAGADAMLQQQAGGSASYVGALITKNDGRVEAEVELPNLDVDQEGVPLGRVNVGLGASAALLQLTDTSALCTDFVLSKNEGRVEAEVEIEDGRIYINNINENGLYPYDPWNGQTLP